MTNPYHGEFKQSGTSNRSQIGTKKILTLPEKSPKWPSVPGKTQSKDRSNGVTKTGKLGKFNVKSEGI